MATKIRTMKKTIQFFTAVLFFGLMSCEKEEKSIVDCFGENLLFTVDHEIDAENSKKVNFTTAYFGSHHTFDDAVNWDFGDGSPAQTIAGKTASHTYTAVGSYTVKAKVSLNNGSCSYTLTEHVTIE